MTPRKPTRAKQLGVTDEQYAQMLERQGGVCAIDGTAPKSRRLDADHDHRTRTVRGLLCHRCNRALPSWLSVGWLARAIIYLAPELADLTVRSIADPYWNARIQKRSRDLQEESA